MSFRSTQAPHPFCSSTPILPRNTLASRCSSPSPPGVTTISALAAMTSAPTSSTHAATRALVSVPLSLHVTPSRMLANCSRRILLSPYSNSFAQYRIFASSFTYAFTPRLANEFRFGFTLERDGNSNPFDGNAFNASTGIQGLGQKFFNGIPHIGFNQVQSVGSRLGFEERSRIFQYVDNITIQARHPDHSSWRRRASSARVHRGRRRLRQLLFQLLCWPVRDGSGVR